MCESLSPHPVPHRRVCPACRRPQLSIATAIVFYHRFYSRKSYDSYDRFRIATTCLFLAGKVEETPKKIKDVVIEAYKAQHQKPTGPEPESKEFWALKEEILVCERILLQTLDFDLTVEHAYRRAPLPRRLAVAPRPRRRPRTRPRSGPDSTDVPVAQATACVREEHQGHARLGAGCVELYQRQPAHHHCSAGALPPRASRLPPPALSAAALPFPRTRPPTPLVRRSRAQYPPRCVAASAVHLASRFLDNKMVLPTHHDKPWCALATHTHTPEMQPRF